jgi:uncharacterized protein YfdQ (DUF2303 family)
LDSKLEHCDALSEALGLGAKQALPTVETVNTDDVTPFFIVKKPGINGENGGTAEVEFVKSTFHAPTFKAGNIVVVDVPSFGAYYEKHESNQTSVQASYSKAEVRATLDWHSTEFPGRGEHVLTLSCQRTPEWKKLKESSGKTFSQTQFAEFIDDLSHCFERPDPAGLTEIVLNLEGKNDATWNSRIDRVSGGVQIAFTEEPQAKTASGVVFPTQGTVVTPVFVGGPPVQFLVKFRYRVKEGTLTVGFVLDQIDRWEREAFLGTVAQVVETTGTTVLMTP